MKKVLIIGCTDVTRILVQSLIKMDEELTDICIAAKDKAQCNEYRAKYMNSKVRIMAAGVDVTNESATLMMVKIFGPELIINLAPVELSLNVMKIAAEIGASYIDGALLDDPTGMLLSKQFEMFGEFRSKGLTAVVGCAYNPAGITTIVRDALENKFDSIDRVDVIEIGTPAEFTIISDPLGLLDNSSNESAPLDEVLTIEDGQPVFLPARSLMTEREIPGIGMKKLYLLKNAVVDDFFKEMPEVTNSRYFAPYKNEDTNRDDEAIEVLKRLGLMSREKIDVDGVSVAPYDLITTMMPAGVEKTEPTGTTGIGIIMTGTKDGETRTIMHYASADNDECKARHGAYVDSYLLASTITAGARLMITGKWKKSGVFTPCAFDASLLINEMRNNGFNYSESRDIEPLEVVAN